MGDLRPVMGVRVWWKWYDGVLSRGALPVLSTRQMREAGLYPDGLQMRLWIGAP